MAQWCVRGIAVVGWLVMSAASLVPGIEPAPRVRDAAPAPPRGQVAQTLGQLPLRFEANAGQFDPRVRYAARGVGYGLALTDAGAAITLSGDSGATTVVTMLPVDAAGRGMAATSVSGLEGRLTLSPSPGGGP